MFIKTCTDNATETDAGTSFTDDPDTVNCSSNSSSASRYNAGFYFPSITVPNGAWIRDAWMSFGNNTTKGDDFDTTWYCEDVDDAANFTTTADVTSRTTTTASAGFDRVDALTTNFIPNRDGLDTTLGSTPYMSGPDISACVQEVVDRGSWSSGNDIVVIAKGDSGTNRISGMASIDSPSDGAKLYIVYTDDADETRPMNTVWVEH